MIVLEFLIQFVVAAIATLAFAVIFAAPKSELVFCGIAGALGWAFYWCLVQADFNMAFANLIGAFALTLYARITSVLRKNPVTVYLITGIFPLVPGAGIYYTSYYLIMNNTEQFNYYGLNTIKTAGAIVLGITLGMSIPQKLFNLVRAS